MNKRSTFDVNVSAITSAR